MRFRPDNAVCGIKRIRQFVREILGHSIGSNFLIFFANLNDSRRGTINAANAMSDNHEDVFRGERAFSHFDQGVVRIYHEGFCVVRGCWEDNSSTGNARATGMRFKDNAQFTNQDREGGAYRFSHGKNNGQEA